MSGAIYWTCPYCHANLDPGEVCEDCRKEEAAPVPAGATSMAEVIGQHNVRNYYTAPAGARQERRC